MCRTHLLSCYLLHAVMSHVLWTTVTTVQALDKAFDEQLDVCKALRDIKFDQQTLNQVRSLHQFLHECTCCCPEGCG